MPRGRRQKVDSDRLRMLARTGAEVTLTRLRAEIADLERLFPELASSTRSRAPRTVAAGTVKRARRMSAAARKAVSERMTKYWAARRRAREKGK